jgi:hypothetical protein
MPRSASVGGLAKRGVIPRKQFYIKLFIFNTVILGHVPPDSFKILLAHTPELFREASARDIDLYLCGHTPRGADSIALGRSDSAKREVL